MRFLALACMLFGLAASCPALDREAFTFTKYDLTVRLEPAQQRIGVRGKITLRNDSGAPQRNLSLQISSTLGWRSVQLDGKPVQFVSQSYTSDIDHTGSLSEAIVSLPQPVPAGGTVEMEIGYEGTIPLTAVRLTRIGVPQEIATHNDWDQISESFTAVRGIGYVAWYPVATEAANLAEGASVSETIARWKARHTESRMVVRFAEPEAGSLWFSGSQLATKDKTGESHQTADFQMDQVGIDVPTFVMAAYEHTGGPGRSQVYFFAAKEDAAKSYADALPKLNAIASLGRDIQAFPVFELPDSQAAPFATRAMLLAPLRMLLTPEAELALVYGLARQYTPSRRAWVQEGLAHYAQALYLERTRGDGAALEYLNQHRDLLAGAEKSTDPQSSSSTGQSGAGHSLINSGDDFYLQTKALDVWWMLREMVGEDNLNAALRDYVAQDDKQPAYIQRLLEKHAHRDLEWFFDDWVYRDRGLPDFHVDSIYPRKSMTNVYLVTVSLENLGNAGAEVPVTAKFQGQEATERVVVAGKSKASVRIRTSALPEEIVVNDGSVPESDMSNNTFKVEASHSKTTE